ncbi:unnamed protein product [Arabidopsis thaliana]|uniref:Uncharacterized protein n=1 Tax=Arabidopsis thaliana TaxID=3702 RepID=A0A5S9XGV3_ARATH|nr:unnamed protein product [Arabidopsis thaliana]
MAFSKDKTSRYSEHVDAYRAACGHHPDLKSFDSKIQQRTSNLIDSLTVEAKTGSVSPHAVHKEVIEHLVEVSKAVADVITDCGEEVWENGTLQSLVKDYFNSTMETLKIFETVTQCVHEAKRGQRYIKAAVAQFKKDSEEKDVGVKKKRYEKTLEELMKFKAMGNPFDDGLLKTQFELMNKQQESLFDRVTETKERIAKEIEEVQKRISNVNTATIVSHVVFGAAAFGYAAGCIALMCIGVGAPLGAGMVTLLPVIVVQWVGVNYVLNNSLEALQKQLKALNKVKPIPERITEGMEADKEGMKSVPEQVDELKDQISSLLQTVDDAIGSEGDEVDVKLDMESLEDDVKTLTTKITEVGETVAKYSKIIKEARLHVLEKITGTG